jgi:adenosylhomocysteine nucleosidase
MLGIITGLTAEAALAAPLGHARAGGGTPSGAERVATQLADQGATALLSFGLAGGLSPGLPPGAALIPAAILSGGECFATDMTLNEWLGGSTGETLLAVDEIVATGAAKHTLRQRTGAAAVDMESGAVAAVARARRLPFAVLRVICDPAESDLPPAALVALNDHGAMGVVRVLGSVLRRPGQVPSLIRLGRHAGAARAVLVGHVARLVRQEPFRST